MAEDFIEMDRIDRQRGRYIERYGGKDRYMARDIYIYIKGYVGRRP